MVWCSLTPGFSGSISINSPALPAMQNWRPGAGLCAGGERTPQISKIRLSSPHKRYCGEDRFLPRVDQGYPAAISQQMRRLRFGRLFRDWNNFDGAHGPWPERAEMSVAIPSLWNRPFHWKERPILQSDAHLGKIAMRPLHLSKCSSRRTTPRKPLAKGAPH